MAEVGQATDNSGISLEHQWGQHDPSSHPSPFQGGILQMWALLPLFVGPETTDNSMLTFWISPEQQRYSRVRVDYKKYALRSLFS